MPIQSDKITVILTAYKRDHFGLQIPAILGQTIPPHRIFIWQNEAHVDLTQYRQKYDISLVLSSANFKYWGRFALASLFDTEYIAIFDDDIIPGRRWLENCMRLSKEKNCIIGANGRNMTNDNPDIYTQDTEYAFVGHCWFFKREWIKHMFVIEPYTYETGEDIHFCACCKLFGGIPSWVPAQQGEFNSTLRDLGDDAFSSYKKANHTPLRMEIVEHFKRMGWR